MLNNRWKQYQSFFSFSRCSSSAGCKAIAFVGERPDGSAGDAAAVAKALKEFAKSNEALVLKGGVLAGEPLTPERVAQLADLDSREVLLAKIAGAFQAPMANMAGLMAALPRNLASMMSQLMEKLPAEEPAPADDPAPEAEAETDAEETADEAAAPEAADDTEAEETADEAAAPEAAADDEAEAADEATTDDEPAEEAEEE